MNRASWIRASAAAAVATVATPLVSGCGQQQNDFVGTWVKTADTNTIPSPDRLVIDSATVDFLDDHGTETSPTATYKVVAQNEAVATGALGMAMKLVLVSRNTLTLASQTTYTRA
jgi:hypothetical protein